MTPSEFLTQLRARGAVVTAEGAELRCQAPAGVLSERVNAYARAHREELLALVRAEVPTCGLCPQPLFAFTRHGEPRCETHTRTDGRCPACLGLAHAEPGPECDERPVVSARIHEPPALWRGTLEEWRRGAPVPGFPAPWLAAASTPTAAPGPAGETAPVLVAATHTGESGPALFDVPAERTWAR
ncbi:MAG: hypothetical protein HY321_21125 [Armatimonadetes bacterium]|nr:hypothetical protein [Armatimonadota bacterium]